MIALSAAATALSAAATATAKPVQVFILMGQSNMLGEGNVNGDKNGTLEFAVKAPTRQDRICGS